MTNYSKLYWLTRLDAINSMGAVMLILSIMAIAITIVFIMISKDFDEFYHSEKLANRIAARKRYSGYIKWYMISFVMGISITMFLPTKNEALFIVAGGKTLDFVSTDTSINKIPEQTTKIISDFLDKQIQELKK